MENNLVTKYVGERKVNLVDLTYLPNVHQSNLEQKTKHQKNIL